MNRLLLLVLMGVVMVGSSAYADNHKHCWHEIWTSQDSQYVQAHGIHVPIDSRVTTMTLEYRQPTHQGDVCCFCGEKRSNQ